MITLKLEPIEEDINIVVDVSVEGGGAPLPWYDGSYEYTPTRQRQFVPTRQKSMRNDLIINEIPSQSISNPFGKTYIIGGQ